MAISSFRAGETIAAGNAVYIDSNSLIYKASALNTAQASVGGLAIDSGAAGDLIRVNTDSVYSSLTGLIPGEFQYLSVSTSGALVDYSTWATEFATLSADAYITTIGRAVTPTSLDIQISTPTLVVYTP